MEQPIKRCRICGDQASGFNYGGLPSCESCKIFFLRHSSKTYKCKNSKSEVCQINLKNRRFCKKCRLSKCFAIGMTKKRGKERKCHTKVELPAQTNEPSIKSQSIRNILEENQPSAPENYIKVSNRISRKQRLYSRKYDLTPQESSLLQEITDSLSIFEDERHLPVIGFATAKSDAFNWISVYARRMVKFCKNMTAFKALQACDQHKILKFAYLNILNIRLSFTRNTKQQAFPVLADESGTKAMFLGDPLSSQMKHQDITALYGLQYLKLHDELGNDENLRNILIALALFTPFEALGNFEFITYQYCIYSRLLQRYLEAKYRNRLKARAKYLVLTQRLSDLQNLRTKAEILVTDEILREDLTEIVVEINEL